LEEQRHNLFTCFKCGRFGNSDEFIVLDWETADGEERFMYVCHLCLSKGDYALDKPTIPN